MEPAASSTVPAAFVSSLAALFAVALAAYVFLLAPGQAWFRGRASSTPRSFARVALSALFTTVVGLGLAASETFSLPRLAVIGALTALFGYVFVARVRHEEPGAATRAGAGAAIFVVVLCLYWPPFETHLAASDSTSYVASGIHLARAHRLWKHDDLVERLSPSVRPNLFFSVMGYPWKPPYARMPGGLVIDTPDSSVVHASFLPAPMVWSALFADALGARYAGGFAALFGALGVWGFWHFARRRLEVLPALLATSLVALNAAGSWAGKFALSEPLAWTFLWAGLVALDAYEEDGFATDARLAAVLLGGTVLSRIEYLPFIAAALALRSLLRSDAPSRPLTPGFVSCFAAMALLACAQTIVLPGSYVSPIRDALEGLWFRVLVGRAEHPWITLGWPVLALIVSIWLVRRIGVRRAACGAIVLLAVAPYVLSSHSTVWRSVEWLGHYVGPVALLLGPVGAVVAWRSRHAISGEGFFVCLALLVTALLVYSPHVYPVMPWASRRYVPLVVPALLLWAVIALVRIGRRSMPAAAVAGALLAVSVAWPARATWRLPFYEGTYAALEHTAALMPKDGALLIDNRLIPLMLAPPLWLAFDRNSLPVDTSTVGGRDTTAGVVHALAATGAVYLLKPSATPEERLPSVIAKRVRDFEIELALPEQTDAAPPGAVDDYTELVSLFELTASERPGTSAAPGATR